MKIRNLTATASGTVEDPGSNVSQKAGLNRVILERGWGNFFRQLEYKSTWKGGELVKVDPLLVSNVHNVVIHLVKIEKFKKNLVVLSVVIQKMQI